MSFFNFITNQKLPFVEKEGNVNISKGGVASLDKEELKNILCSKNDDIIRSIGLSQIIMENTQEGVLNSISSIVKLADNDSILAQELIKIFQKDVLQLVNTTLTREWNFQENSLIFKDATYKNFNIKPKKSITVNQKNFSFIQENFFQLLYSPTQKDQYIYNPSFFKTKVIISGSKKSLKMHNTNDIDFKVLFTKTRHTIIESLEDLYLTWAAFPFHASTAFKSDVDIIFSPDYGLLEEPNYYSNGNATFDIEYSLLQQMDERGGKPSHHRLLHHYQ